MQFNQINTLDRKSKNLKMSEGIGCFLKCVPIFLRIHIWENKEYKIFERQIWLFLSWNKNESEFIPRSRELAKHWPRIGQVLTKCWPSIGQELTKYWSIVGKYWQSKTMKIKQNFTLWFILNPEFSDYMDRAISRDQKDGWFRVWLAIM